MPFKERSNKSKWRQHKKQKTAMTKKSRRGNGKKRVRWMIGKIGIQREKETLKESET
jgi:hypothetical protein